MLLLQAQSGCGSRLKREIHIPCIAMELLRTLVWDIQSSLEVGSHSMADYHCSLVSRSVLCNVMVLLPWVLIL